MWPFKKKKHEESPEEAAAWAKLDDAVDEAAAEELDKGLALTALAGAEGGVAGGLGMAMAFDREPLLEKADEAEEDAKP
jgi:hypothetical protein